MTSLVSRPSPDAYWGVRCGTRRGELSITGQTVAQMLELIRAFAFVKKAAAHANLQLGAINKPSQYHFQACDDLVAGQLHEAVRGGRDQGGAGTSIT